MEHEGTVFGAIWNEDETRILTWSSDNTARLWTADGQPTGTIMQHGGTVLGAAWNHDESRILSWSADSTARVWDTEGQLQQTLSHDGTVLGGDWDAGGQRVLTWTRGNNVLVWDAGTGQQIAALPHGSSSFGVQGAVWSASDSRILSWSSNGVVRVWDVTANDRVSAVSPTEMLRNSLQHTRFVVGATWNADETRVLSWSTDDTARIWDVTEPRQSDELFVLAQNDAVNGGRWNSDETRVLTWNVAGVVKEWVVDVGTLIDIGRDRQIDPLSNTERRKFFLPTLTPSPSAPTVTPVPPG